MTPIRRPTGLPPRLAIPGAVVGCQGDVEASPGRFPPKHETDYA
jgi:hypothetical protein